MGVESIALPLSSSCRCVRIILAVVCDHVGVIFVTFGHFVGDMFLMFFLKASVSPPGLFFGAQGAPKAPQGHPGEAKRVAGSAWRRLETTKIDAESTLGAKKSSILRAARSGSPLGSIFGRFSACARNPRTLFRVALVARNRVRPLSKRVDQPRRQTSKIMPKINPESLEKRRSGPSGALLGRLWSLEAPESPPGSAPRAIRARSERPPGRPKPARAPLSCSVIRGHSPFPSVLLR